MVKPNDEYIYTNITNRVVIPHEVDWPTNTPSNRYNTNLTQNQYKTLFIFRKDLTHDDLWQRAKRRLQQARTAVQRRGDDLLFPVNLGLQHGRDGSGKPFTPDKMARVIAGGRPKPNCQKWDEAYMCEFVKFNSLANVTLSKYWNLNDFFPAGAPLLDLLIGDRRLDQWRIPINNQTNDSMISILGSYRGLNYQSLNLDDREIILGETTGELLASILEWARDHLECDLNSTGVDLLSLDCEEVSIPKDIFRDILRGNPGDSFSFPTIPKKGVKCSQLPAKIMVGNGMGWILLISTLALPLGNGTTTLTIPAIQPEVLSFLEDLPRVTGVGIESDVMEIEDLLSAWTGRRFRMRGFVTLPSIAVLAGWNLKLVSMPLLSTQVLGGMLNKAVSRGDHGWGVPWRELPTCMRVYCVGDVKFGFQTMLVLLHIILRDLFPDPDIVLSFTRLDATTFITRFNAMIIELLVGTVVDGHLIEDARSRKELAQCLRVWTSSGKRSHYPPERVVAFAECYGGWPSLTNGGCRFLHQARYAFLGQCEMLRKVPGWTENIMPYEVTDEMREFATYTMPGLEDADFSEPVAEVSVRRLYRLTLHPALASHVISGTEEASRFTSWRLLRHCRAEARIAREVYYEWFRLRLSAGFELDEDVFALIRNDSHYWTYLRTYYNELRRIYLRATGIVPPRDEVCDQKNAATAQSALDREAEHVRQLKALVKQRCNRMAFYANVLADDDSAVSSLTWRLQVPAFTTRKEMKRSRLEYAPGEAPQCPEGLPVPEDVAPLREADEDSSEGRHRSKKARRMASVSPARPMTQDEFEETIGRPPPVHADPPRAVDPEGNFPALPQAVRPSHWRNSPKKARRMGCTSSARPVFQDEFEETIGRPPPVPVDPPRVVDLENGCPPLPRAFWPSQRWKGSVGRPRRVIAEITLCDGEDDLAAEERRLLDAPDSEGEMALETVASNSPGLLDRLDSPL